MPGTDVKKMEIPLSSSSGGAAMSALVEALQPATVVETSSTSPKGCGAVKISTAHQLVKMNREKSLVLTAMGRRSCWKRPATTPAIFTATLVAFTLIGNFAVLTYGTAIMFPESTKPLKVRKLSPGSLIITQEAPLAMV